MRLVLSTSNIMGGGPAAMYRHNAQKSNAEFTTSLQANFTAALHNANTSTAPSSGDGNVSKKIDFRTWTSTDGQSFYIPSPDFRAPCLAEERSQYDITVKLFFLPNNPASCRCSQTRSAIDLVLQELKMPSIDLLIVSFPGVSFDGNDEDGESDLSYQDDCNGNGAGKAEEISTMIETWECLEELHEKGVINKLGVAEFGKERLAKFLAKARVRPRVNQINVRDCCVVPRPLILFAKQEKVELLTHNDCTNILPTGTVRELLGHEPNGVGVLADSEHPDGLNGNVSPQWVIKYTAVVRDRGVIENKGYFAMAELN